MKSSEIIIFENEKLGTIKGLSKNGEPWFLAGQVCRSLGIKNASDAVNKIRERYRIADIDGIASSYIMIEDDLGRKQKTLIIPEPYLYELIFNSRKKKAIEFRSWITTEVIPSIRKHGYYRHEGKIIRRSLTDSLKDTGENERMHGHAYSTYTRLIYKSLGLPNKIDRNNISYDLLEKIAVKENMVSSMVNDKRTYQEIKDFILS